MSDPGHDPLDEVLRTLMWLRNHYHTGNDDEATKAKVLAISDWVLKRNGERLMFISIGRMKPVFDAYKASIAREEQPLEYEAPKKPIARRGIKRR